MDSASASLTPYAVRLFRVILYNGRRSGIGLQPAIFLSAVYMPGPLSICRNVVRLPLHASRALVVWLCAHRRLAYSLYLFVLLIIGITVAELVIRRLRPDSSWATITHRLERVQNRLRAHEDFHHILLGTDLDKGFPIPSDPPDKHILVVGDSYVHGSGVKRGDRFATHLANSLGSDVKVSVLATPSYSPIIYRNLIARALEQSRFQAVVLCVDQTDPADDLIYVDETLAGDARHRFDAARITDRLQIVDSQRQQLVAELSSVVPGYARRLTLVNVLFPINFTPNLPRDSPHFDYVQRSYVERTGLYARFADEPALPEVKRMEELMFDHLDQIVALCEEHDARLILTANAWEYQVSRTPVMRRQFRGPYPRDNRLAQLLAGRYESAAHVQCVSMTAPFRERTANGAKLYLNKNIHWNNDGHELVAEILIPHVEKLLVGRE